MKISTFFTVLGFMLLTPQVLAKDVSIQQSAYNNALQKMERAEATYKSDAESVADTEKLIEKKKRQLAEEQKKADASKQALMDAKAKLEQAQLSLDKAWKE